MKLLLPFIQIILLNYLFTDLAICVGAKIEQSSAAKRRLKILVYSPTFGWSHMQFMGTVADTLADAGHEVHFLRVQMNERTDSLPAEVHNAKVCNFKPKFVGQSDQLDINQIDNIRNSFSGGGFTTFLFQSNMWEDFCKITTAICQELSNDIGLISRLEAEHFDVTIAEPYDLCPFAFFHRIGAKTTITTAAIPLFQILARRMGIPTFSSYVTNMVAPLEGAPSMNFWERAVNFYNDIYEWAYITELTMNAEQIVVDNAFGSDFPSLNEIGANISLLFVNSNQFFELPRPISNKVINIGGLVEMRRPKNLESNINEIMEKSKFGTVLISFGSFADPNLMSKQMKLAFLRAFARFPDYEFIWKLDLAEQDAKMFAAFKNVHPVKWVDQKAMLMHPKLRAFVSHCGQNSLSESIRAGKPVVAIPLFGDQLYNAIMARHKGVAVNLDVAKLNGEAAEHLLAEALDKILHDPSYRENAELVRRKWALTPFAPREKLVRWVEFAAEFPGGGALNELNLPWEPELGLLAYYSVDVILFTATVLALCGWILYKLVKLLAMHLFFGDSAKII